MKTMVLDGIDQFVGKWRHRVRDAKGAVAQMTPGAPGNLADFRRIQFAELKSVIFAVSGKGDMIDIQIEAHADGVGGDEEIDIAILVQFDLLVAGARAERAENHGRAAALPADQFGDRIDLMGGEGDDRRPARQAGQFF